RRDAATVEAFRFTDASEVEAALGHRCHPSEDGVLPLPVEEVRRRRSIFRETKMRGIFPYHHQLFGVFEGQWPQEDGVDDAEDCAVCADAESESDDSDDRKPRVFHERAQAVTQVLPEIGK